MDCVFKQEKNIIDMTEKELINKIKDGSKDWHDWKFTEKNEKYYREIERRNQLIPKIPENYPKIFRDDPQAIEKMKAKIIVLENIKDYWKRIIKFPNRVYGNDMGFHVLGDEKFYAGTLASTNLNMAKKKLALIENQGTLTRKPVFIDGKKHFKYVEDNS
jgi:hypothetical protein